MVMKMSAWYDWSYNTKEYLHNKELQWRRFPQERVDHVHCEICWAKIGNLSNELHEGYYEPTSNSWICHDCFVLLRNLFNWNSLEAN